jgi:hypothetical protein
MLNRRPIGDPSRGQLPKLPPHRPSEAVKAAFQGEVKAFCTKLLEVKSGYDKDIGSRGWAYLLEGDGLIDKNDLDAAQALINDCRKSGDLPLDFCAEDEKRAAVNVEEIDNDPKRRGAELFNFIKRAEQYYYPFSFWDDLDTYLQVAVEKSDLKSLFEDVCAEFHVPIANIGGWADLNVRGGFMQRFKEKEAEGKRCILLDFTDFDPGGLHIADKLRSNLNDLAKAVGWSPDRLEIDRFGLDYETIERLGLVWINNLASGSKTMKWPLDDPRHPDHNKPYVQDYLRRYGARKVEANALLRNPAAGRLLMRQAILKYIPANAVRRYERKLIPVRAELRRELDRLLKRGRR